MSDNKPEPVVTQEDQDAATAYRVARYRAALNNCELGAVDLDIAFAAHRTAAVARREAEIVGMIMEYANIANEEYVYDDLRKLCAMIQGKPLPKSTAEIVQEQIGKSMDRPDAFPSIE